MAGHGPAPKPASTRARRNKPVVADRVINVSPEAQPGLPDHPLLGERWPPRTVAWWHMWASSPLAAEFTANDWSELLDTAVLHAAYWTGRLDMAGELRLRVAKFGATPEDRARLRITFAVADEKEQQSRRERPRSRKVTTDPRMALRLAE